MKKITTYDLLTVDWNPQQTMMWKKYVGKNCHKANVMTFMDKKPFPSCWSSGKIGCFEKDVGNHPTRYVYIDTDTIVLRDIDDIICTMERENPRAIIGSSLGIAQVNWNHVGTKRGGDVAAALFDMPNAPTYIPSGLLVFKNIRKEMVYDGWCLLMENNGVRNVFGRSKVFDEIALSFFVGLYSMNDDSLIWEIPKEMHGNILPGGRKDFGECKEPWIIHYHNIERLRKAKLDKYNE